MNKYIFTSILILGLLTAEAQTFKAGVIVGLNASQIRGDDSAGFNKLGIVGGLRAGIALDETKELSLEILYGQRGSFQQATNNNPEEIKINTDYISVPILFSYKDWLSEESYHRLHFIGGLSYGRLLDATIQKEKIDPILDEFSQNDISWILGATYFVNRHLGITARYNRSFNKLFNSEKCNDDPDCMINSDSYLGFFLSFQIVYMF